LALKTMPSDEEIRKFRDITAFGLAWRYCFLQKDAPNVRWLLETIADMSDSEPLALARRMGNALLQAA
jgi:hypothetical protein